MCDINKSCSCGCKKDLKESIETKKFMILAKDPDGSLESIMKALQTRGNTGHSFSVEMDKDDDDGGEIFGWDGDGGAYIKSIEVETIDDKKKKNKEELDEDVKADDAAYYEKEAKALAKNGYKREAAKVKNKAKLAAQGKLVDGELVEAKMNLKITSNTKRELIKQAKTALDSIYNIYNICEKQGITVAAFMRDLDMAFEGTNEMLTALVIQDSVEKK